MASCSSQCASSLGNQIVLECDGGQTIPASRDIICMLSPLLSSMLTSTDLRADTSNGELPCLKVHDTTVKQWQLVLGQVYPAIRRPVLTLEDIAGILHLIYRRLTAELPGQLPNNPRLTLQVLGTAKELQLDWLATMCLEALQEPEEPHFCLQLASGQLDADLKALGSAVLIDVIRAVAGRCVSCGKPCSCNSPSRIHRMRTCCACMRHRAFCRTCNGWVRCCKYCVWFARAQSFVGLLFMSLAVIVICFKEANPLHLILPFIAGTVLAGLLLKDILSTVF